MNKNILFIATYFPPDSGVSPKINYKTAQLLKSLGNNVYVLTKKKFKIEDNSYNINEFETFFFFSYNETIIRFFVPFLRFIKTPPVSTNFFYVKSIVKISKKIIKNKKIDIIYSVFGTGNEHEASYRLKKIFPHIIWISEYQDPWINYNLIYLKYFDKYANKLYKNYILKKFNKIYFNHINSSDYILVETPLHENKLKNLIIENNNIKNKNIEKIKLNLIGYCGENKEIVINNYEENEYYKFIKENFKIKNIPLIIFTGSTYSGYDYILEAFINILIELFKENYKFYFFSFGNNHFDHYIKKLIKNSEDKNCPKNDENNEKNINKILNFNLNFNNIFNIYTFPFIEHKKLLKILTLFDFGLTVIMKEYKENINSKLYEYAYFQIPILSISPEDGSMAYLINKYKIGYILSYEKDKMKENLKEILTSFYKNQCLKISNETSELFKKENLFNFPLKN
ncbi:MAG: hypothetical protein N3A58_06190 [Spirochaetes bacterium]|nr:hypothetical protein [Spirochaetota bacterium]